MKDFIINNIALLGTILVVVIGLFKAVVAKNKQKIYAEMYELITDAQKLESTNDEKFVYVFNAAYNKLPKFLKFFVSKNEIKMAIEYSLNKLKAFAKAQTAPVETPAAEVPNATVQQ